MGILAYLLAITNLIVGIGRLLCPIIIITAGYGLFQTANNTGVMPDVRPEQRGAICGLLNLPRNLGLVIGVSVMGAVVARA